MGQENLGKFEIFRLLKGAKDEIEELGGLRVFRTGDWVLPLIGKSFKNYSERATAAYLIRKYPTLPPDQIAQKLIDIAARNAAIAGAITGAAVSVDELVALFTAGEGGVGVPANLAVALAAVSGEVLWITKLQLQLVMELSTLYEASLDPEDPEDVLTILAFAAGGGIAELAGKAGMKIGSTLTARVVRKYIRKEVLETFNQLARKLGFELLQRTIINAAAPGASVLIGAVWNRKTTKKLGKIAIKHFEQRRSLDGTSVPQEVRPSPSKGGDIDTISFTTDSMRPDLEQA